MNNITPLEQRIAAVEALIAENRRRVEANPDNFAAALQLDSARNHPADLKERPMRERAAHQGAGRRSNLENQAIISTWSYS